eukprot:5061202-Pleurochrysis_carterae.AAC.2
MGLRRRQSDAACPTAYAHNPSAHARGLCSTCCRLARRQWAMLANGDGVPGVRSCAAASSSSM